MLKPFQVTAETYTLYYNADIKSFWQKLYKRNPFVLLTGDKNIMWAGSCDLNEYSSTNFTIQVPKSLMSI